MSEQAPPPFPDGHFYSPIVDLADIESRRTEIWPPDPACPGLDFGDASHHHVLGELFPRFLGDYDYPEHDPAAGGEDDAGDEGRPRFYTRNPAFSWLDARSWFVLLRAWRPKRVIEIGGGYSTLLAADVNHRFLDGAVDFTCIEPYPMPFLRPETEERGIRGLRRLIEERIEKVDTQTLLSLERGDILFIDSSHVSKTGSDVNHLLFEILPRLAPGVKIHFHDIFLPHDYPPEWVLGERRSWNEQYLLRALLVHSTAFRILFGSAYALHRFPELLARALDLPNGQVFGGGSLWIERMG